MATENVLALELANESDFFLASRDCKTRAELAYEARCFVASLVEEYTSGGTLHPLLVAVLRDTLGVNWLEVARKISSHLPER